MMGIRKEKIGGQGTSRRTKLGLEALILSLHNPLPTAWIQIQPS